MNTHEEIPLFPLGSVLFSGGRLPLRIFEPRYLDLVGRCMKTKSGFGVVLIREGTEVPQPGQNAPPTLFDIGTYARIVDFNQLDDGMLGIVCAGDRKYRIHHAWQAPDQLTMAEVEFLPDEESAAVDEEFESLVEVLRLLTKHPMVQQLGLQVDYDDARSISWRLAELLPLQAETKQALLNMHSPQQRLEEISRLMAQLRG